MGVYACYNKQHPRSQVAMGLGAVLTVFVGGTWATIALSPTLLTGNAMWIGIGVGAFVLVAICAAAFRTCHKFGGGNGDKTTGAVVFATWTSIIAVTATGGAMIAQSTLGQTWESISSDPAIFIVGASLVALVIVTVAIGFCCTPYEKSKPMRQILLSNV